MITSTANEKVRFLRSLHEAKARRETGCFLIEGVRLVEEALRAGSSPCVVLVNQEQLEATERGTSLLQALGRQEWFAVSEKVLKAAAATVAPQGVVAAVPMPVALTPEAIESVDLGSVLLVLDRLSDPGNVGTILRSAVAADVRTVALIQGSVDPYSPKVVRSGVGAHFHLNLLLDQTWRTMSPWLTEREVLAAVAEGDRWHFQVDWTKPSVLVIGSEAHGVSAEILRKVNTRVAIPMAGQAESLNAAVATSVILFEALRQRLLAGQAEVK